MKKTETPESQATPLQDIFDTYSVEIKLAESALDTANNDFERLLRAHRGEMVMVEGVPHVIGVREKSGKPFLKCAISKQALQMMKLNA